MLVLADSVRRLGGLGDTYDFVALVDQGDAPTIV